MDWSLGFGWDLWQRVALCLVCGGAVGLERQLRGKPAGMRTSMLITMSTMLFVRLGAELGGQGADPTRVLGQVVTGIGFLGAGVILTRDGLVMGMTSAAVVWTLAAIGCAVGLDRAGAAISVTAVTLSVLVGVTRLEKAFRGLRRGVHDEAGEGSTDVNSGLPPPVRRRE